MVLRRMGPHEKDHIAKTYLQIVEEVLQKNRALPAHYSQALALQQP